MTASEAPITIRAARKSDLEFAARIIADPPNAEWTGLCESEDLARRLGIAMVKAGASFRLEHAVVAETDREVVGVMEARAAEAANRPFRTMLRGLLAIVRIAGVRWALRMALNGRLGSPMGFKPVRGSYEVAELDVDPASRNRGIGGALLKYAEDDARRRGFASMSLATAITNPARRLYERHGYVVIEEKRDADYERITHVPGRILMVKELASR